MISTLYEALDTLTSDERALINLLFLENDEGKSEREISREMGIPQKTLNCRKMKILQKLRSAFAQN